MTTSPDSVTVSPRARSSSGSRPIRAFSGILTFLSTIARRTTACRPTSTQSSSTLSVTDDQECTYVPGDNTEFSTMAPETTTPGETVELTACPMRPCQPWTNLAGG